MIFFRFTKTVIFGVRHYAKGTKITGKNALVTGACSIVGKTLCDYLLKNGAKSLVMASKKKKKCEKLLKHFRKCYPKTQICYHCTDFAKKKDVLSLLKITKDLQGNIDLLVNNATMFKPHQWPKMIKMNIVSMVRCLNEYERLMSKKNGGKGGTVVNLTTVFGLQSLYSNPIHCGTAHFITGFTKSYKKRAKKTGISVMGLLNGQTEPKDPNIRPRSQSHLRTAKKPSLADMCKPKTQSSEKKPEVDAQIAKLPIQHVCFTGEALIKVLQEGKPGSLWVSEGEEIYEVKIPDRKKLKV